MSQANLKKIVLVVWCLGGSSLVIPLLNIYFSSYYSMNTFFIVSLVPSFIILLAAFIIRFVVLNVEAITAQVGDTCGEYQICDIKRYIHYIFIAMVVGVAATVTINFQFLTGAFIYLLKHVFLLIAFSGIINFKFVYAKRISKKMFYILYVSFWAIVVHLIFLFFVLQDIRPLILLPYGYALASMTAISILGLFYTKRSLVFRVMVASGALVFLFSDLCIMLTGPELRRPFFYLINPTYVLAIFLLCYAQLFLRRKKKN